MIVGLTGGIASGKTFCTDYLHSKHHIEIIDADLLAREVVAIGSEGLQEIQRVFGDEVITQDGTLDRKKMRALILQDDASRIALNEIVHPRVRKLMLQRLHNHDSEGPYKVLSVPLLFENNLHRYADIVVVVDVDEQTQLARVQQRDQSSEHAARKMLGAQIARSDRLRLSHFVINNNGSMRDTLQQLDFLHNKLCDLV